MINARDALEILTRLSAHPSRSSAITISEVYVLNGQAVQVVLAGLDALRLMPCAETVSTLSGLTIGPQQAPQIVSQALSVATDIVGQAAARGYGALSNQQLAALSRTTAIRALGAQTAGKLSDAAQELLAHAHAALAYFNALPDF